LNSNCRVKTVSAIIEKCLRGRGGDGGKMLEFFEEEGEEKPSINVANGFRNSRFD
jgi:hypothetical protein